MGTLGIGLGLHYLSGCTSKSEQKASDAEAMAESESSNNSLFFDISLAQWSLHGGYFGNALEKGWEAFGAALMSDPDSVLQGELDPLDFASTAKDKFGIEALEYVNTFYYGKVKNQAYLNQLKQNADNAGVKSLLIMCDALGNLGDTDEAARTKAVENHYPWVDAAKFLGCHSIRVNAAGSGTPEEVQDAAVQGLGKLTEYSAAAGINIIVENHGGYSSDAQWLAGVMQQVNSPHCGTLPDFGNFCIERGADGCANEYDRYKGVEELMPYAKGVSAKSHVFNEAGEEVNTDFGRMLKIVKNAGFNGHIGVEYEGSELSEDEGIMATKKLLIEKGKSLS